MSTAARAGTSGRPAAPAALALGALGVVFGDIGTSPLYAFTTVFSADGGAVRPTPDDVYGVISLIVWAVTLIVSIKFVTFIMRADNGGEGGIMALVALIRRTRIRRPGAKAALILAGLFGVALFYGDGMITPAVSVLSAVEGVEVAAPSLAELVLPATLVLLTGLFLIQRFGTAVVARLFGPVMVVWFVAIAALGLNRVIADPEILQALSPHWAVLFFVDHLGIAFIAMGSVVLAITGAEALYADMGHFGRRPIRRAWFLVVFPALTLNYLGQGSLVLENPRAVSNSFYLLVPEWAQIPMVALATVATLIASQAVISGAFSVTRQAVQLGYLPRLTIRHTSEEEIGQVYVPVVNWLLFAAVAVLVVAFGSSERLATAYGIAVTGTFLIDAVLFLVVVRVLWRKPLWMVGAGVLTFVTVDLLFVAANLTKIEHGGWFPLAVGALIFLLLTTWDRGRAEVSAARMRVEGRLLPFLERLRRPGSTVRRVPGVAIYLNPVHDTTPLAMRLSVERIRAIHERVVLVTVRTTTTPHVPEEERISFDALEAADDFCHVMLRFGFMDSPDIPRALMRARHRGPGLPVDVNPYHATWFLSNIAIVADDSPGLARWRKRIFIAMARNAANPADYFGLPAERVVTIGARISF